MAKAAMNGPDSGGFANVKEEISFLRQKFGSLTIRGHYKECFKLIEDNIKLLYFNERWPENFYSSLLIHKRCFLSMDIAQPYGEYLEALLRKHGIPAIFAELVTGGADGIKWSSDHFKELAMAGLGGEDYQPALDYAEIMIKIDALNSNAYLLKGWILQGLKRDGDAEASFKRALELNKTNYQASSGLADIYSKTDPKKALDFIGDAIKQLPGEASFHAAKARILSRTGNTEGALAAYDDARLLDPLNPEYIYQKAELLLSCGQDIAAARQYGMVLDINEGHIPALIRLANLTAESQPELALSYINTVVNAQPENLSASLIKARLLERKGEATAAIRQYKITLELDSACAAAHGALGNLYMPDFPERALPYYEKAAELCPTDIEYHLGKGKALELTQNPEAAAASYKAALALDKNCARAHASLGNLYMETDPKAAIGHFNKAIAIEPECPYYYQAKGELLMRLPHSKKDALACYDKAVRFDPGNADLRFRLAKLLEEAGSLTSAIENYRFAASLAPDLEEAFHRLARLLLESEPENALLSINSAISLNPNRAEYYYLKSRVFIRLGRSADTVQGLKQILEQDKNNFDAVQELNQLLDGNAPRVAMMHINRALEISPDNPAFLCTRAELLYQLSESAKAKGQYQKALDADNGCHEAMFGIGKILAEKRDEKALYYLDMAIAVVPGNARYRAEKALFLARDPGNYQAALTCFDEAIALDKQMWDIVLAKARLLEKHGENFPAIAYYRRVLLISHDCLEAHARLGVLLAGLNPVAALNYLTRAVELEPGNYIHRVWRGRIFYETGNEPRAEEEVKEALRLGGESDEVFFALAQVLYESMPETALKYCRMAMAAAPGKAAYPLLCGNIYRAMGETENAKKHYLKAMELDFACHEALARTAEIYFREENPQALEMIDRAIGQNGGNASYYYVRGLILEKFGPLEEKEEENGKDKEKDHTLEVIKCMREAVRLAPGDLSYREKLVELIRQIRAPIQYLKEKHKLGKLRRELRGYEEKARANVG